MFLWNFPWNKPSQNGITPWPWKPPKKCLQLGHVDTSFQRYTIAKTTPFEWQGTHGAGSKPSQQTACICCIWSWLANINAPLILAPHLPKQKRSPKKCQLTKTWKMLENKMRKKLGLSNVSQLVQPLSTFQTQMRPDPPTRPSYSFCTVSHGLRAKRSWTRPAIWYFQTHKKHVGRSLHYSFHYNYSTDFQ